MGFFDYIVACVLALVGSALTFVLGRLILLQVLALLKIGGGKGKLRRATSRIEKADNYIQNNELLRAANQPIGSPVDSGSRWICRREPRRFGKAGLNER